VAKSTRFDVKPLTRDTWGDLVELFNRPGASIARGCWCMYYRKKGAGADADQAAKNRRGLRTLVGRGTVPGLIAYDDGRPVGWISLGPREDYQKLERSPVMKPVDDKPVWSIVCFFIDSKERGRGVAKVLLNAGMDHARANGATLLEAYPVDKDRRSVSEFLWFGTRSMFERAGFTEVARRKPTRPVMRKRIRPRRR